MIVQIIPAIKLPRSINQTYSYNVPPQLEGKVKVGQIIETNFKGRTIQAVITAIDKKNKPKFPLKEFNKITTDCVMVTDEQIELIKWMAAYYYLSPALLIKSLVPKIPKKTLKHESIKALKQNTNTGKSSSKKLIHYGHVNQKIKLYAKEITKNLKNKKQTLIVVPTINDLEQLEKSLIAQKIKKERIILITAKQGIKEEFEKWSNILSGKPSIILSTKIGIFYPFQNLHSQCLEE